LSENISVKICLADGVRRIFVSLLCGSAQQAFGSFGVSFYVLALEESLAERIILFSNPVNYCPHKKTALLFLQRDEKRSGCQTATAPLKMQASSLFQRKIYIALLAFGQSFLPL